MKQFDEVLYSVSEVSNRLRPDRLIVYASMVLAQLCTGKMVLQSHPRRQFTCNRTGILELISD